MHQSPVGVDSFSAEREGILEALRCVVGSNGAVYLATPITGGLRFINWYELEGHRIKGQKEYDVRCRQRVIIPNCETAKELAEALRSSTRLVVIDPSRFFLDHWTQPAYRTLWCEVVRRFATAIHFNEGWWASVGCAQELLTGLNSDIPLFEGIDTSVNGNYALQRVRFGIEMLRKVGAPYAELSAVAREIETLVGKERIG